MKFTIASVFTIVSATMASALPSSLETRDPSECLGGLQCCGTLTTPVDGLVDGLLMELGIDGAEVVGSVGLACHAYTSACTSKPVCCTEANVLNLNLLSLGCSEY